MGKTLPYSPCGYTGVQYRGAYEGPKSGDGTGVTVVLPPVAASHAVAAAWVTARSGGLEAMLMVTPPVASV